MFSAHSLPSEIIINIIGDKYGSIFYFTVFGVLLFWSFLGIFGHFGVFLLFFGFQWGVGGFGSASELYKITRGTILVVGRFNDWV